MSSLPQHILIRRAFIAGALSTTPLLVAAVGWSLHWNAYINLSFTFGGAVILWSVIASTLDRYRAHGGGESE